MKRIMKCPGHMCDGEIQLIRTIRKRSLVTKLETESCVIGCDTGHGPQLFVDLSERTMSEPELNRLAKPEECGYEHG